MLSEEQKKIVEFRGKPMRVLAGPGTGKTFCIIARIKFLLKNNISYKHICAITFTRVAAAELRERLEKSKIDAATLPYVNTLHGFAYSILRKHCQKTYLKPDFRPISNVFNRILIQDVFQDLKQKGILLSRPDSEEIRDAYFRKKANPNISNEISANQKKSKLLKEFSDSLREHLYFYNAVDWADVLNETITLMDSCTDVRTEVHAKTKYLLVDEYQDLSPLEQHFVHKLAGYPNGLCVVGDDDQSIYETFRFASPQGLIDFTKKYPIAERFEISTCRRCPKEVIDCALSLINNNKRRVAKELVPLDPKRKGFVITLCHKSKKKEIQWLVLRVSKILNKGLRPHDIMILFTDRDTAKDYVIELQRADFPLNVQLRISDIFGSEHFLGLISIARWLVNNDDNLSLRLALYYWPEIGPETARQLRLLALSSKSTLWRVVENIAENPNAFKAIRKRKNVIEFYNFLSRIKEIKSFTDFTTMFFSAFPKSKDDKGCVAFKEYLENLKGQEENLTFKEILEDFEQKIDSGELENKYRKKEGIRVMTMHSAKGCEAPVVIIPALEDDVMPGEAINIEERRRLFYVSITRAINGIYLSWARQRSGPEIHRVPGRRMLDKRKSRFLSEMMNGGEASQS